MKEKLMYAVFLFNLFMGIAGVLLICRLVPALHSYGTLLGVVYFFQYIWFLDNARKKP